MDFEITDTIFGLLFTALGGILKHIYGKFEKIDNKNELQDKQIGAIDGRINLLASQKDDIKKSMESMEIKFESLSNKISDLLFELRKNERNN